MFNNRSSWFYGLLVAALVGPYALLDKNMLGNFWSKVPSLASFSEKKPSVEKTNAAGGAEKSAGSEAEIASIASFGPTARSNGGAPPCDIPEAFRFGVS